MYTNRDRTEMSNLEVEKLSSGRKLMVFLGIGMLGVSVLMSLSVLFGLVELFQYELLLSLIHI